MNASCSAPARDVTMSSRYAQLYSQQAYLSQLLQRSGYGGELPPFLSAPSAPGADHPLLTWMASALGDEHFMSEASVSEAQQAESDAMQQKLSVDAAAAAADVLLQGFEEADDLLPLHDQKQPHSDMATLHVGLPGTAIDQAALAWPYPPGVTAKLQELDCQLEQAAAERALYRAQIQELQALETQLESGQRSGRSNQLSAQSQEERLRQEVASESAAIAAINMRVNGLMQDLQSTLQDLALLTQQHSHQWLTLVGSQEKEVYLQQSSHIMDLLSRCNLEQPQPDSRGQQLQRQLVGAQEDQEGWLDANNPFLAPLPPSLPPPNGALPGWGQNALTALRAAAESVEHGGGSVGVTAQGRELAAGGPGAASAPVGLSADEEQRLLAELQRLSDAGKGAEGSLLRGRLEAAQHAAELEALMTLLSQTGNGGGTDLHGPQPSTAAAGLGLGAGEAAVGATVGGAVGAAQLAQLEREVKGLEEEEARLLASSVPAALEQLVSLQEAAVLGAHYRLQGQVLEGVLRRRTALVRALLDHLARHQLLAAVQAAEQREMQGLYTTVQALEQLLGGLVQAANRRCAVYAAARSSASGSVGGVRGSQLLLAGPNGSGPGAAGAGSGNGGQCSDGEGGPVARLERVLCSLLQPHQQQQGPQQGMQQALQQPAQHDSKPPGSAAGGAGGRGAAWQLQQLHGSCVSALSQVSEAAFEHMGAALAQARSAAQASRDLLYPNPNLGGSGSGSGPMGATVGGVPRIVLHPAELGEKLRELRMTACEMNELINSAVADNAEYHRRVVDSKDEVVAERSVLEWFYLDPNKLNDHVVGVEQRIAAMRL